jgi:hypothetical protein
MNEHVASYYYDMKVDHGVYDIYACYDSDGDYLSRTVSFYDVYDKNGICVNEGNPFYEFPTWEKVFENYYQPHLSR